MQQKIKFVVPGKPQGKGRPRFSHGHTYTPEKTREYERQIATTYKKFYRNRYIPAHHAIRVIITAVFAPPKSASKKARSKMLSGKCKYTSRPDIDNIAKAVYDALNGCAWADDAQIVEQYSRKIYGEESCVIIEIEEVEEEINNENQYN